MVDLTRRRVAALVGAGLAAPWAGALEPCRSPAWADALRRDLHAMAERLRRTLRAWPVPQRVFRPEDYGAIEGIATRAIQGAVDACAKAGGGVVRLSKGDYVSGTIDLRSGVMLEIAAGARLVASTRLADYPERRARRPTVQDSNMGMNQSLIFAEGCERVGIRGKGTIEGRGTEQNFPGEETISATPGRPFLIRMLECRQVVIQDVRMRDSPCWMQNYLNCEDLLVEGIHVENLVNHNNDGLDIDGCRRVIVRHCFINSGDDALCFKGASQRPIEQVLVEHCQFFSACNALKFGTDSQGDFRDVLVRKVTLGGPALAMRARKRRKADGGVSWESVDGGTVERVLVQDAHIVRAESPLFLRLGDRGRVRPEQARPRPGKLRRIVFERISGDDNGVRGSFFTGIPGHAIEDVLLRDVRLAMAGTSARAPDAATIPEAPDAYPDPHMFEPVMPALGLWTRHVHNLTLQRVRFGSAAPDARPAILAGLDTTLTMDTPCA